MQRNPSDAKHLCADAKHQKHTGCKAHKCTAHVVVVVQMCALDSKDLALQDSC
jgi:hypothetical protein